jgi:hypothetical protein
MGQQCFNDNLPHRCRSAFCHQSTARPHHGRAGGFYAAKLNPRVLLYSISRNMRGVFIGHQHVTPAPLKTPKIAKERRTKQQK